MKLKSIHDKSIINDFLAKVDPGNYIYQCNNSEDPVFWTDTQWYGLFDEEQLMALAMYVIRYDIPVLLAASCDEAHHHQAELLRQLKPHLPSALYAHLDKDAHVILESLADYKYITPFFNMKLDNGALASTELSKEVQPLTANDFDDMIELLKISHPDYMMDREYFDAGYYVGLREDGKLISVAGGVSKSETYSTIAIGNVTTHPDHRQKGCAKKILTTLHHHLSKEFDCLVLNVKQKNTPAVKCYEGLGYKVIGAFEEVIFDPDVKVVQDN